jgi:hypothetical protein
MIEVAVHADGTEDGVRLAGGAMDIEAAGDEAINHVLDLGVGGAFLHYDDHEVACFLFGCGSCLFRENAGLKPGATQTPCS